MDTKQRKLGVVGGLGTDTAAQFYVDSEKLWHAAKQHSHIPLMLENSQSSFALEQSLSVETNRISELCNYLCKAAASLEDGGASIIVIPCNTAHVHIEAVRTQCTVPVLSITEEVAKKMKSQGVKKAAILGTRVTRNSGIYNKDCQLVGIETLYPDEAEQKIIERIIQRALSWKNDESDEKQLLKVVDSMRKKGADAVVLACTDLQLCMPKPFSPGVIDSMQTLCQASVHRLLQEVS